MDESGKRINLGSDHEFPMEGEGWPSGDKLNRREEIENLSTILLNAQTPLVMAIDSPLGGGKSTFIRLWRHYLRSERDQASIHLNAWKNDSAEDPLLPLLVQINEWLSARLGRKEVLGKFKEVAFDLLKTGLAKESGQFPVVGEAAEAAVEALIDRYSKYPDSISDFKRCLSDCLSCISDEENLIVFVDELDCCSPPYAIAMLELIKHLFNVERIVFVLAINSNNLISGFEEIYGPNFNGESYLKRFVNFAHPVREPELESYIESQFERYGILATLDRRSVENHIRRELAPAISIIANHLGYSLRDVNQLLARVGLILPTIPDEEFDLNIVLLVCLLTLRDQDPELYKKYASDQTYADHVIPCLTGLDHDSARYPQGFGVVGGALLQVGESDQPDLVNLVQYWTKQGVFAPPVQSDVLSEEIDHLREYAEDPRSRIDAWRSMFDRVELVSKFDV